MTMQELLAQYMDQESEESGDETLVVENGEAWKAAQEGKQKLKMEDDDPTPGEGSTPTSPTQQQPRLKEWEQLVERVEADRVGTDEPTKGFPYQALQVSEDQAKDLGDACAQFLKDFPNALKAVQTPGVPKRWAYAFALHRAIVIKMGPREAPSLPAMYRAYMVNRKHPDADEDGGEGPSADGPATGDNFMDGLMAKDFRFPGEEKGPYRRAFGEETEVMAEALYNLHKNLHARGRDFRAMDAVLVTKSAHVLIASKPSEWETLFDQYLDTTTTRPQTKPDVSGETHARGSLPKPKTTIFLAMDLTHTEADCIAEAFGKFVTRFPRGCETLSTSGHQSWCMFFALHRALVKEFDDKAPTLYQLFAEYALLG
ncbi:hypothetical protein KVR01_000626 [Diaporthe batatas]|uniref:uncharacterized protein n=1 Tax=Diaporthe batatas TaxID=748121 RepID=UPI001D040D6A|nr:uncharacterized protein KVR01_000626 [Diaporthe batatas]KAG8169881.1 hypothetical protein KVR01_000626 [Diaporthe batatas]